MPKCSQSFVVRNHSVKNPRRGLGRGLFSCTKLFSLFRKPMVVSSMPYITLMLLVKITAVLNIGLQFKAGALHHLDDETPLKVYGNLKQQQIHFAWTIFCRIAEQLSLNHTGKHACCARALAPTSMGILRGFLG